MTDPERKKIVHAPAPERSPYDRAVSIEEAHEAEDVCDRCGDECCGCYAEEAAAADGKAICEECSLPEADPGQVLCAECAVGRAEERLLQLEHDPAERAQAESTRTLAQQKAAMEAITRNYDRSLKIRLIEATERAAAAMEESNRLRAEDLGEEADDDRETYTCECGDQIRTNALLQDQGWCVDNEGCTICASCLAACLAADAADGEETFPDLATIPTALDRQHYVTSRYTDEVLPAPGYPEAEALGCDCGVERLPNGVPSVSSLHRPSNPTCPVHGDPRLKAEVL